MEDGANDSLEIGSSVSFGSSTSATGSGANGQSSNVLVISVLEARGLEVPQRPFIQGLSSASSALSKLPPAKVLKSVGSTISKRRSSQEGDSSAPKKVVENLIMPLVRVRFLGHSFKSKTCNGCTDGIAVWDERVDFPVSKRMLEKLTKASSGKSSNSDSFGAIEFAVIDSTHPARRILIGQSVVPADVVRDLLQVGTVQKMWLPLEMGADKSQRSNGRTGELLVSYGWLAEGSDRARMRKRDKLRGAFAGIVNKPAAALGVHKSRTGENIAIRDADLTVRMLRASANVVEMDTSLDSAGVWESQGGTDGSGSDSDASDDSALNQSFVLDNEGHDDRQGGQSSRSSTPPASLDKRDESLLDEQRLAQYKEHLEKLEIAELRSQQLRSGKWRIICHVLELRDLVVEGLCWPRCSVVLDMPGRRQIAAHTGIRRGMRSCIFDDQLFLECDMSREELDFAVIRLDVWDSSVLTKDLVGSYSFNLTDIYFEKDSCLQNQWVGLARLGRSASNGVQGYAKLSVNVLGPGDVRVLETESQHPRQAIEGDSEIGQGFRDDEDRNESAAESQIIKSVLLPPNVHQPLHFCRVRCYFAEGLPTLDSKRAPGPVLQMVAKNRSQLPIYAATTNPINAAVQVSFEGRSIRTRSVLRSQSTGSDVVLVVFNEELWLPTLNPCLVGLISVRIMNKLPAQDALLASLAVDFQKVVRSAKGRLAPRWYNLYGAPPHCSDGISASAAVQRMNKSPNVASAYRGRILLGLRDSEDSPESGRPESVHSTQLRPVSSGRLPKECIYVLRLWALVGSDLPGMTVGLGLGKLRKSSRLKVVATIGGHRVETSCVAGSSGSAVPANKQRQDDASDAAGVSSSHRGGFRITSNPCGEFRWSEALATEVVLPAELAERWHSSSVQAMVEQLNEHSSEIATLRESMFARDSSAVRGHSKSGTPDLVAAYTQASDARRLEELDGLHAALKKRILLALQEAQVPDIFLYLQDESGDTLSYARFRPESILLRRFSTDPMWIDLKRDPATAIVDKADFAGSLQFSMGFGPKESVGQDVQAAWSPEKLAQACPRALFEGDFCRRCTVIVNVFQGKELPTADASGLSDPFAVVRLQGALLKTAVRRMTLDPVWYESLRFDDVLLPTDPRFSPKIRIDAVDYNRIIPNEYLGSCRILVPSASPPESCERHDPSAAAEWYPVYNTNKGDRGSGALLISVEVFPHDVVPPAQLVPRDLRPKIVGRGLLQIVVLGLRELTGNGILGPSNALVKFHLGDASKSALVYSTRYSNRPNPNNPNYGELIEIPVDLPENRIFLPTLHVTVEDSRLGGLQKPVLAVGSFPLLPYVLEMELEEEKALEEEGNDGDAAASVQKDTDDDCVGGVQRNESLSASALVGTDGSAPRKHRPWYRHEPLPLPAFMEGRAVVDQNLEDIPEMGQRPFKNYQLSRGLCSPGRLFDSTRLDDDKSRIRNAGILKAAMRVVRCKSDSDCPEREESDTSSLFHPATLQRIMIPTPVSVRLYVLKGFSLTPKDFDALPGMPSSKSDPYLKVSLGRDKQDTRRDYIRNSVEPAFYHRFDLQTTLPGPSRLEVSAIDRDLFPISDDLIGSTSIDLEDRWFSHRWACLSLASAEEFKEDSANASSRVQYLRKPVELRSLWAPTSQLEQGKLECWLDIMDSATAQRYPAHDIRPPANRAYEVRLIIWGGEVCDQDGSASNLYVRANLGRINGQPIRETWKSTDIHWRCKDGKASWNYRLKFKDVELPCARENSTLILQMWNKCIPGRDKCLGEVSIDMDYHFKRAFSSDEDTLHIFDAENLESQRRESTSRARQAQQVLEAVLPWASSLATYKPPHSKVIPLFAAGSASRNAKLRVSVELVRKDLAETILKNATGRSSPNRYPELKRPAGRLRFSVLANPAYIIRQCIGAKACNRFYFVLFTSIAVALMIVLIPDIGGISSFISSTGWPGAVIVLAFLIMASIAACLCCGGIRSVCHQLKYILCCCWMPCCTERGDQAAESFVDLEDNHVPLLRPVHSQPPSSSPGNAQLA